MQYVFPMLGILLVRALPELVVAGFTFFSPGYIKIWLAPRTNIYLSKEGGIEASAEVSRITDVIFVIFSTSMFNLTFLSFFLVDLNIGAVAEHVEYLFIFLTLGGFIAILVWSLPYNKRGDIKDYVEEIEEEINTCGPPEKHRWMPGLRSAKKLRGTRLIFVSATLLLKITGLILSIWAIKIIPI